MKLLIKVYADDLKSPSLTNPLIIKGSPSEITIRQLKVELEAQIKPQIKYKD